MLNQMVARQDKEEKGLVPKTNIHLHVFFRNQNIKGFAFTWDIILYQKSPNEITNVQKHPHDHEKTQIQSSSQYLVPQLINQGESMTRIVI